MALDNRPNGNAVPDIRLWSAKETRPISYSRLLPFVLYCIVPGKGPFLHSFMWFSHGGNTNVLLRLVNVTAAEQQRLHDLLCGGRQMSHRGFSGRNNDGV